MPTELEELVGFISNPNPQIRQLAVENLVPFSTSQPSIFKADNFQPIKNLKILILDHPKIAEHALTILVNLSGDAEGLKNMATDDKFLSRVLSQITSTVEPNANLLAMLLANLVKWEGLGSILERRQEAPKELKSDDQVINQLLDLFVRGSDGGYNKSANYDYLAYVFADLANHADVRRHLLTRQVYDEVVPLAKIKVFTEHPSTVRRKGVASTIKNAAFDVEYHGLFLADEDDVVGIGSNAVNSDADADASVQKGINLLPYLLLPLAGNENYDDDEMQDMLPDLQLLPPDKQRDPDKTILLTHVETLTLLTTTRVGRDRLRAVQVYPLIRETHLRVDDEDLRDACDRLVQVLMRDEAKEAETSYIDESNRVSEIEDDEDERIVEV